MLAGSLSIQKRCFSFGTVDWNDQSSVWPLLPQSGCHHIDDCQCSSDDRRDHVPRDGHGLLAGQGSDGIDKIVKKPSGLKDLLP
jgi:hypothetical protein